MDRGTLLAMLLMILLQPGSKTDVPENAGTRVELRSEIPFSNRDTTRLDSDQVRGLLRAADEIIEKKGSTPGRLIIEGHAVGAGSQTVSEERARLVRRWLETTGILGQDVQLSDKGVGDQGNKQAVTFAIERSQNSNSNSNPNPYKASNGIPEIPFETGKADISSAKQIDSAWQALRAIEKNLQGQGSARVLILGHATSRPTNNSAKAQADAQKLSEQRAQAVRRWLEDKGLRAEMVDKGTGSEDSKAAVTFTIERR